MLAANLHYYTGDPDEFWWLGYALGQGGFLEGGGSFIKGGSQQLSNALVKVIRDEGGEAKSKCEVFGVELDAEGRASGVRYFAGIGGTATMPAEDAAETASTTSSVLTRFGRDSAGNLIERRQRSRRYI